MLRGRSLGQAIGVVALVCATFGVSTASAQVDYEIMASLQFNFSNPGARSLAMAGALTGAGDDATGAWTNPGGLTNITRPEVGVEFRGFDFETPFVTRGRFSGTPTNIGIDTIAGRVYGTSEDSTHSLSFVSAVVPKSRFAFAFYRTEVANFEADISTDGAFFDRPGPTAPRRARSPVSSGTSTSRSPNFGGSAAVRLTDQVSVGVGVSVYDFELDSANRRFRYDAASRRRHRPATSSARPCGRPDRTSSPPNSSTARIPRSASTSAPRSAPNDKFRIGASYRQGPKFDIALPARATPSACDRRATSSEFKVPDVFALGVLIKPVPALNITVDYRRVQYSQVTSDMGRGFDGGVTVDDYVLDDGNEIRAAGEYLFTDLPSPLSAIAVRGGFWHDPDHRIRYEGAVQHRHRAVPGRRREMHFTGRRRLVFEKVQFDVGFDRSETVKTFSVSAVLRF